jgi:integrase/recombinase XerD
VTHCRQIMLEELQRRNFAPTTISTYLHALEQFARHFKCRPDRLNQTHFRSYQAYLVRERKMRPLTVRLHVAALRFFFVKMLKRRVDARSAVRRCAWGRHSAGTARSA